MIRPVTSADRAVLRELLAEFYDTDAVLHPLPASYHDAALDELFRSDSLQRACLLEQDGETAGYGLLSLKYSHEAAGWSCGWRSCMSAPPSAAAAWAMNSSHGCAAFPQRSIFAGIRLETEPENERAAALYARMGFSPLGYCQMFREEAT